MKSFETIKHSAHLLLCHYVANQVVLLSREVRLLHPVLTEYMRRAGVNGKYAA